MSDFYEQEASGWVRAAASGWVSAANATPDPTWRNRCEELASELLALANASR